MKRLATLLIHAVVLGFAVNANSGNTTDLFIQDGQVKQHKFLVYVTTNLTTEANDPHLELEELACGKDAPPQTNRVFVPVRVVPQHRWVVPADGIPDSNDRTLLIFDLKSYHIPWWKPMVRLRPILSWREPGQQDYKPCSANEIYLGNLPTAIALTFAVLFVIGLLIALGARQKTGHARYLFCGPDRYYSLWRTQLVAWTVAVGGSVFCFGMIRVSVPDIPTSLVSLMGMSLATGLLSSAKDRSNRRTTAATPDAPATKNPGLPSLADLISGYDPVTKQVEISIPKAQMVFWTMIVLSLFLAKTYLNGQLWDVPLELVGLTGFSQAGYVTGKFTR